MKSYLIPAGKEAKLWIEGCGECVAVQGPAVVVGTNVRQLRLDRLTPDKVNQADPILGNKKNKNEKYGGVN